MQRAVLLRFGVAVILLSGSLSQLANATPQTVFFDTLNGSVTVGQAVNAGDTLYVDTLVRSGSGALAQSASFTLGAGVTGLTGHAAWMIGAAAGPGPRLVGFNVDLVDANTNALVTSDVFGGVLAGYAHSTFVAGISPGDYRLVATGTGVRESFFDLALSFTGTPPVSVSTATGAIPTQGLITNEPTAFFSKLNDARTMGVAFKAGESLIVDSLVTSDTGALEQLVTFTLESGVDSLTGFAQWDVSPAGGIGARLVGVNIDLLDAGNTLIASDSFSGVLDDFAHSTIGAALGPGTYKIRATGTGVRDASLNIALTFGGTPTTSVPEPSGIALTLTALGAAALGVRRRTRHA